MSASLTLSTPAPAATAVNAATLLSYMAAQSGVLTDYNTGSQVRTFAEAAGAVIEEQSTISAARAFQAIVYGAFAAFGFTPLAASQAVGVVTFSTGTGGSPPPAPQAVLIPQGTILQTAGGIQFEVTAAATLAQGSTSVNADVVAVNAGVSGNVAAGAITTVVTSLGAALLVSNAAPTTGGAAAESTAASLSRFSALVQGLGDSSPLTIANAVVGVTNPSVPSEYVKYAVVYEPWADPGSGITTAAFKLYVDNGSGAASSGLLAAVTAYVNGALATSSPGKRPAGVPWSALAVNPVPASVTVTATTLNPANITTLSAAISTAVTSYFAALPFGASAVLANINAAVVNVCAGYVSSLVVVLDDGSDTSQTVIAASGPGQRLQLTGVTPNLS